MQGRGSPDGFDAASEQRLQRRLGAKILVEPLDQHAGHCVVVRGMPEPGGLRLSAELEASASDRTQATWRRKNRMNQVASFWGTADTIW
jgi:hypothetical protein